MSQSYNPISSPLNIPARLKSHKLQHTKHRPRSQILPRNHLMLTPQIGNLTKHVNFIVIGHLDLIFVNQRLENLMAVS